MLSLPFLAMGTMEFIGRKGKTEGKRGEWYKKKDRRKKRGVVPGKKTEGKKQVWYKEVRKDVSGL